MGGVHIIRSTQWALGSLPNCQSKVFADSLWGSSWTFRHATTLDGPVNLNGRPNWPKGFAPTLKMKDSRSYAIYWPRSRWSRYI